MEPRVQIVTLHLSDGREISMLAPVFAEDGGQIASLVVSRISVHPPVPSPEGFEPSVIEAAFSAAE
jgi:hypothetical protein